MALTVSIDNKVSVKDGTDVVASLNKAITDESYTNHSRSKETINPNATITLDFASVQAPKYLFLVASAPVSLVIGAETIAGVTVFELKSTIPAIDVLNADTANSVSIDYILCE